MAASVNDSTSLKRQTAWMISGHTAGVCFQAIYFILIGRTLGSHEYGAFVGVVALVNVLTQISSLGMEMILVRNISRDPSTFAETWGKALSVSFIGFLILLAVAIFLGHMTLAPALWPLIPCIALSDALFGKIVQLASRAFQGACQLSQTAKLTTLTNMTRAITALGFFIASKAFRFQPTAVVWTRDYWVSSFVTAIVAFFMVARRLGWPRFTRIRRRELADGLSFSLSSSSVSVYNDMDKTILASQGQLYAAGIYAAAYRIIDVASIPIYALYAAASPRFFKDGVEGIRNTNLFSDRLLKRTIPYAIFTGLLLIIGSRFVTFFFGTSFRGSGDVICWLALLPLLRGLHYAWGTTITGASSQWYRTATQLGAAIFNFGLNTILIPRWSWRGAALASLLTDGVLALSSWMVLRYLRTREERMHNTVAQIA